MGVTNYLLTGMILQVRPYYGLISWGWGPLWGSGPLDCHGNCWHNFPSFPETRRLEQLSPLAVVNQCKQPMVWNAPAGGFVVVCESKTGKPQHWVNIYYALRILAHLLRMVMEPKYLSFRRRLYTPCSSSDVRWARIPRDVYLDFPFVCKICAKIHTKKQPLKAEILHGRSRYIYKYKFKYN